MAAREGEITSSDWQLRFDGGDERRVLWLDLRAEAPDNLSRR